jgi:iron complex transport system substrate-binding protein
MRLLALAAAAVLLGLSPTSAAPIVPFADASRVVAIGGSLTEIVYALGEEVRLAGRDSTGTYPPEAQELPDVGYKRSLAPEGVLSVNPSAILVIEGSGPAETLSVLSKAGVPYVEVPEAYSSAGVLDKVRAVGAALGVDAKAEALAAELEAEFDAVAALTADLPQRKRVMFVLSTAGGKIMASGTGTAADGIIGLAGAVNAIDAYAGYKSLNDEAVIFARPDAILLMLNGGDGTATADELLANPAIALTPAGENRAIIAMDGEYLLGFGPRTPAALRDLVRQLYPGAATE